MQRRVQRVGEKTQEDLRRIQIDMNGQWGRAQPVGKTCAARVVRKGSSDAAASPAGGMATAASLTYRISSEQQKADWQAKCCTECNVSFSVDFERNETHLWQVTFSEKTSVGKQTIGLGASSHSKSSRCKQKVVKVTTPTEMHFLAP